MKSPARPSSARRASRRGGRNSSTPRRGGRTKRPGRTSTAELLIARLRLDHQRIRALLQLLHEHSEGRSEDEALLDRGLIARDALHYLHAHVDTAHHALEEQLFRLVRGREPVFDAQIEVLEQQHRESGAEETALLDSLEAALNQADGPLCSEPLQAIASYAERMLVHLAYEEQLVLDRLEAQLAGIDAAALPRLERDPLFEPEVNSRYASLYAHYLNRTERVQGHASVLDSVPLDPLVEALGLVTEQLSVYAGLMRRQHLERSAARKQHAREFRRAPFIRKPVVAIAAIGAETARSVRQKRELLHEIFVSPYGTVASVRDFLRYVGRRMGKPFARRSAATR